ncbi:type II toxin-antitoxin system VapC family toxin [Thiohalocapsa sp. ML1]|jgi:uncharacterized protein|uniref:type II toxin-antitoxin system VapC family toxin n=1 Tax=Thiohalocapsa sp. ML1 TaxID=1431688 RepID=UPI0007321F52|nr:type II toxin-antitoxin system VapC family toxin [Thiohalocapsa sp. ML1]
MKGSVYLDTCIVIDLVEGRPDQQDCLSRALEGQHLVSSDLVRLESRVGALRKRQNEYLETYRRLFDRCVTVPLDRAVFDLATDLRVRHGLKTPDALHLAAALHVACEELWTNDRRLASAAEGRIQILTWDGLTEKAQRKQPSSVNPPKD